MAGYCTIEDAGPDPSTPQPRKQHFVGDAAFRALRFTIADETYFSYGIASNGGLGRCGVEPNTPAVYTFYAHGDLDGDGIMSTFELAAGSNDANALYHGRGFYIDKETE